MPPELWAFPMCLCGHHAVYHDVAGKKGCVNPHVEDYHERPWPTTRNGGLATGHCSGSAESACHCTSYRPVVFRLEE